MMNTNCHRILLLLLVLIAGVISITHTVYVGNHTVYENEPRRLMLHNAILHNQPPEGGWKKPGANGTNTRILAVYLAEGMSRVVGVEVLKGYKIIDTVATFL